MLPWAWAWPVPVAAGVASALSLVTVIALLAFATLSTRYQTAARAGTAGCLGTPAPDVSVIVGVAIADPAVTWAAVMAMTASAIRVCLSARLLRLVLARA
jgi:hypothetical protein